MKKKRDTLEHIIMMVREVNSGLRNYGVCLEHNISQQKISY